MGWFSDRFGRGKKRHVRGNPLDDDDDGDSNEHTRLIRREPESPIRVAPAGAWDPTPVEEAPVERVASDDVPTQVPAQRRPPPRPVFQPDPDFSPNRASDDDDNRTIMASKSVIAVGKLVGVLLGVEGPLTGQVVRIYEGPNLIGREGQPDPLPNTPETKTISRKHAVLNSEGGYFAIEPVRPENATFVGDKAIDARELIQHGDRIRMGSAKPSTFVLLVIP